MSGHNAYSEQEQTTLLRLTHDAIFSALKNEEPAVQTRALPRRLKEQRACFVTLKRAGALRGCIGHILPVQPLWRDVVENARAAACDDSRFPALTREEFAGTTIEISVLTLPKPFPHTSARQLLDELQWHKCGVIVKKGQHQSTFLPQVWEELPTVEEFLNHLCLKAGLRSDEWRHGADVELYDAEKIVAMPRPS